VRSRSAVDRATERGAATAEFAIALPALALILAIAVGAILVAGLQVRAQDAAADAARGLARGDSTGVVGARLDRHLPGASLESWREGDLVCVRVSIAPAGTVGLVGVRARGQSCALGGGL
jgi:hypothetical protein